jgi:signal peptidase I
VWKAGQLDSPTTLEVATLDKQFLVAMDGVSCLSFDYEQPLRQADGERTKDPGSPQRTDDDLLAIGACGLEVELKDVRLLRDVYYTQGPPVAADTEMKMYRLGADEFFVLGDNSPVSLDSRQGRPDGVVKEADLLGKPWRWR